MRPNKLRRLLNEDKPSLSTHVHTTWPSVAEVLGHTGLYDYVEFVAEYGPFDLYALDDFCRACELHDLGAMIKVDQEPRGFIAQRAIGSGFQSVLFADSRNADDVRECVRVTRAETPEDGGTHGVATRRFSYMGYGGGQEYVKALREVVVMAMIEKGSAVDQLEEILAIEGLDMVQWGPADYSMSIGKAGQWGTDTGIQETERRVIEMSLAAGVQPRAEIASPDQAKYYQDLGVKHFCIGTDIVVLFDWWKQNGEEMRKCLQG
mgnify:CR=1 FL=1